MNALTRANVDVYHANHRQIWTWTADTVAELQKAWSLGTDSVGTDIPRQAAGVVRTRLADVASECGAWRRHSG